MIVLLLVAAPLSLRAQVQMQEDFSDHIIGGNLVGLEGWMQYQYNESSPIQVLEGALPYEGYPQGVTGNCVKLEAGDPNSDAVGSLQKAFRAFCTTSDASDAANVKFGVTSGSVYFSALLKIDSIDHNDQYIMTLLRKQAFSSAKPWADKNSGTETGRLYSKTSADGKGYHLGVNPAAGTGYNSCPTAYAEEVLNFGQTYLVVVRYEINAENNGKDNMYLYINPADYASEPAQAAAKFDAETLGFANGVKTVNKKTMGFEAIELAQSGSATYLGNAATISMLRVADSWKGIFTTLPKDTTPRLTIAPAALDYRSGVLQNTSVTAEILVKGKHLINDVQVKAEGELAASVNQITKDEANKGIRLNVTLTAKNAISASDTTAYVVFTSEGAEETRLAVNWVPIPVVELANLKEAAELAEPQQGTIYKLNSEVTITHVEEIAGGWSVMTVYYFEDESAGGYLIDQNGIFPSLGLVYNVGDRLKNIVAEMMPAAYAPEGCSGNFLTPSFSMENPAMGDVVSQGNVVAPKEVLAEEYVKNLAAYTNTLVKVSNLTLKEGAADAVYANGMPVVMVNGANEIAVDVFANTELEGQPVGAEALNITGISTSSETATLRPRSKADVEVYNPVGIQAATAADAQAEVYDMSGRKVAQLGNANQVNQLPAGLYIVKSHNGVKKIQVR